MSGVDDRIVSMKFDNGTFEQRLAGTIQSLDRLTQSLDFANSTRGMNELSAAGKNFNLGPMAAGVDGISAKFIALSTIAITTLATITQSAVSSGAQFIKGFSFGPVIAGFKEFETNMNSIQTILANTDSKGTTLTQVSGALDELNLYSDQTIYNFAEMAKNIGTFTAAGVGLETATASIKGIANLAAISGSNSQQASTAMYQLSQAISTGSVKLMDWNSVVNAGMGGEVFQKALFETGKSLGTLKNVPMAQTFDQWKAAGNSFRSSLSETGNETTSVADQVAKASKDSAKDIAQAEKAKTESVVRGAESIASAQERQTQTFERAAKDIKRASENQRKTIEDGAKATQGALDRVTAAQLRLKKAMEPERADDMQAIKDSVTTAQLDKVALVNAITEAQRDQTRAAEDLAMAKRAALAASNPDQIAAANRRIEDAEARVRDTASAVTRARIQQNTASRSLTAAEEALAEAKKKGTSLDQNVIDATKDLALAKTDYQLAQEDQVKRNLAASEDLKNAEIDSAKSRKEAIKDLSEARKTAAENDIRATERVAEATERASERIANANDSAGGRMKQGWLTDKVLTNTLQAFTGDLTEAQLVSLGYTKEQAVEMMRLGKIGKSAATEVKTFTQLMGTVKESIASGWSQSFRGIIGDFKDSKELFTGINNSIGGMVGRSADARNKVIVDWKELGGRNLLIRGFKNALAGIASVLTPIQKAFREIFPKKTAEDWLSLTKSFAIFTSKLRLGGEAMNNLKRTFAGLFAIVEIGWAIFKGLFSVIGSIISSFSGTGSGILGFTANLGDALVALNKFLVDGGAIRYFFDKLGDVLKVPIVLLSKLTGLVVAFFASFSRDKGIAEDSLTRVEDRINSLSDVMGRLTQVSDRVKKVLDDVWMSIRTWFSQLGEKLAGAMKPGDFDAAVDIVNVGLLAGIAIMLKKFIAGGFKFDFGNGFFDKVGKALDGLTGKLHAMQANVKADTLMKIAIAVGILAASVLVLSLIDSEALRKSLVAMAVGFGQLVGTMAILDVIASGPKGAVTLAILVAAMIGLASAMVILSGAILILSKLDPKELATGLAGMAGGIAAMVLAVNFISANPTAMLSAGVALVGIATGMVILATAVKIFATMSWAELAKGLTGVAIALGIVTLAMTFMPIGGTLAAGLAMIPLAIGLGLLAGVVKIFGEMSWGEMLKGMVGIGAALVIIAGAMQLMPLTLPLTAAGLILVGIGLNAIALAVLAMGSMDFGTLAKGLGGIAIVLGLLAIALNVMNGTLAGSAALLVASGALFVLAIVMKILGQLSFGEIVKGLFAMAGVLAVLGIAASLLTPVIPMMLALGAALLLIGGGFALFGIGVLMVAKGFEALAKSGVAGAKALVEVIKVLLTALPTLVKALVESIVQLIAELLKAVPMLLRLIEALLLQLLETIIKLAPKIAEAIGSIITAALKLIREKFPDILQTGFEVLDVLMRGIRDNIGKIITLATDIIINLATALNDNAHRLVEPAVNMLRRFLSAIGDKAAEIVGAGLELITKFVQGIVENISKVIDAGIEIVKNFVIGIANKVGDVISAGADAIAKFVKGIGDNISKVVNSAIDVASAFIRSIGDNALKFARAAGEVLVNFLNGLATAIREKSEQIRQAGGNIATAILEGITGGLTNDGGVMGAITGLAGKVIGAFGGAIQSKSPSKVFAKMGGYIVQGLAQGINKDESAQVSAVAHAERIVSAFQETLAHIPDSLAGMAELNPVITPVLDLTKVQAGSRILNRLIPSPSIAADVSFEQARQISKTTELETTPNAAPVSVGPTEVKFEQNIYSPDALSTNDIYRNTKSQIAMAKEELSIP